MTQTTEFTPVVPPASSMARKATRRKESDFNQCLKQYATAAIGVAGMSALAVAQAPAHHIWYTVANIPLTEPNGVPVQIDFNHDGITDITISATGRTLTSSSGRNHFFVGYVNETPAPGNLAIGGHAIPKGAFIEAGGAFKSTKQILASAFYGVKGSLLSSTSKGPFKNVTNKYLGVKFLISGQVHFGWIRLTIICNGKTNTNSGTISGTITGYAFDTVANEDLLAGQIRGPVPPVNASVEEAAQGSLGMLALGSSAIPYRRK